MTMDTDVQPPPSLRRARGQVAVTSSASLFSIVGIALYGLPFFYDFMVRNFGWSRAQVTRLRARLTHLCRRRRCMEAWPVGSQDRARCRRTESCTCCAGAVKGQRSRTITPWRGLTAPPLSAVIPNTAVVFAATENR